MLEMLKPRTHEFFEYFDRHADQTVEAAKLLVALVHDYTQVQEKVRQIKSIEHAGDQITHETVAALHKTFITPLDRDEIHRLISRLDDVLDLIEAAADKMALYEIPTPTPEVKDLTQVLLRSCEQVKKALAGLRNIKKPQEMIATCVDINRLENEADLMLRNAVARLFREEKDALQVIKWKEIYQNLEDATDRCEDVANIIEGIVLEHA